MYGNGMPEYAPPPSSEVISAFRLSHNFQPLPGGLSRSTYRSADYVLKRVDDAVESEYNASLLSRVCSLNAVDFNIPRPVPSNLASGAFTVQFWTCTEFVQGTPIPQSLDQWTMLLKASRAFHATLRELVPYKPSFLNERSHRWEIAQRVAFNEHICPPLPPDAARLLQRLADIAALVTKLPEDNVENFSQLVHGDIAGNVLFTNAYPPAIIDFSPYWRPVAWAEAILVSDGLVEYGAPIDLVYLVGVGRGKMDMLIKAMIFRVISDWLGDEDSTASMVVKWDAAVDVVLSIVSAACV